MKIELRTLDKIDPCQLVYFANDRFISQYLRNTFPYPYTLDHAMSFISYSLEHQSIDFGIVVNDVCIGNIGVTFQNDIYIKNCELGYWIGREYWGKNIASHVVSMMCDYLFENYPIMKINAEVFAENEASARVLEKNGFEKEGYLKKHVYKNKTYYDLLLYGLRRECYDDKTINT